MYSIISSAFNVNILKIASYFFVSAVSWPKPKVLYLLKLVGLASGTESSSNLFKR